MSLKFLTELSDDYKNLFESEFGYDVIIYAGEEPNIKEIHAHSNILCIRSQYFRSAFSNEWAEKKDGKFIFKKPNISPHLLGIILRFIYYGNIELNNLQGTDVLKLLIAVDELNIQSLITYIQEFLIKHQTEFLNQNPSGVLETVYHHEAFTDLWDFFLEEICKEPKILFNSDNFVNLKAPLLELLLKRDDLDIEEVEIWENLLSSNQDGFNTESFHNNCDNKGATIWVAKIQGSTQLIGGYNPLDWEGNKWKTTSDSFIFNFTDIKNNSTVKYLGYVNQKLFAVYCGNEYGPKMGYLNSYSSKNWTNNNNNNGSHIYPNIVNILPSELFLDILKIHMVSDAKPNVEIPPSRNPKRFTLNSTLINEENLKISFQY
ncbi:unnamed protein product [Rhizophagus irregularis]|nr:unnamed protein product [Rhizophagus irregularis]